MRAAAASLQRPGRGGGGGRRPAPSKAALPGGVAETVLAQLEPDSADPGRAAQLRTAARGCRQLALARRHVVPLLVTRPLATPLALRPLATLRPLDDVPILLTRAGFSGPGALHIYRALPGFLHAHPQLQELTGNPGETADLPRLGLHRLPAGEIPLLPGLACVLAGYDGPPNPDADPASSWPGSQRHCLPRRSNPPRGRGRVSRAGR